MWPKVLLALAQRLDKVQGLAGKVIQAKKKIVIYGVTISIGLQILIFVLAAGIGVGTGIAIGSKIQELIGKVDLDFLDGLSDEDKKDIKDRFGDKITAELDCSNLPPEQRKPGRNCIEGLIAFGEDPSAIPARAEYLLPVWKSAAKKYNLQWELVAAVSAARTSFGLDNCKPKEDDDYASTGFYRMPVQGGWSPFKLDAGNADTKAVSSLCYESKAPLTVLSDEDIDKGLESAEKRGEITGASVYDAVDTTYAQARMLRYYINEYKPVAIEDAKDTKDKGDDEAATASTVNDWKYTGSEPGQCSPRGDGKIYFVPDLSSQGGYGSGSALGFNARLDIPRDVVEEAAKWRSNSGALKPRRTGEAPAFKPMPKETVVKMLRASWTAFGVKDDARLSDYVTKNYAQINRESGSRPNVLQGYIGDVNDNNPAGGLFQFIPGTFNTWKVDGFNDRFNPLDNILAAVNAQTNSGMGYILSGASGWGPGSGANPYTTGGKSQIVDSATPTGSSGRPDAKDEQEAEEEKTAQDYKGEPLTDPISRAVKFQGGTPERVDVASDCYVAVVHDWYQAIKDHPPKGAGAEGGEGSTDISGVPGKIIKDTSPGKLVPLPGEPGEQCDNRVLQNVLYLKKRFKLDITDCYGGAPPHAANGEHPLGVGIDAGPNPAVGGTWKDVDALSVWTGHPLTGPSPTLQYKAPFRWVGYNGDANHGSGNHIHISWNHAEASPFTRAAWVQVFELKDEGSDEADKSDKDDKADKDDKTDKSDKDE